MTSSARNDHAYFETYRTPAINEGYDSDQLFPLRQTKAISTLRWFDPPQRIQVDNGPEFVSKVLDRWAYEQGVQLAFSRPGKPTDNAHIEAFNGRLRQECLNLHWFLSLQDARHKIEDWRVAYNESRPHGALDWATPAEFARRCLGSQAPAATKEPENSAFDRC